MHQPQPQRAGHRGGPRREEAAVHRGGLPGEGGWGAKIGHVGVGRARKMGYVGVGGARKMGHVGVGGVRKVGHSGAAVYGPTVQ